MLIIFSGPPAAGKSTIARRLAPRLRAVWLCIDTLETPIMAAYGDDIADVGYRAAYGVAEDNLRLGHIVIADCVNDITITRDAWRAVAERAGTPAFDLEVLCSDQDEHRRRVET
jgi:predicted kinase